MLLAPVDSQFFVAFAVTMPYSKAEFGADKQGRYEVAIARAAGTVAANVDIVSITEAALRRGGVVKVDTKIRTSDASSSSAVLSTLGRGVALKNLLNAALAAQGLQPATDVSSPSSSQQLTTAADDNSISAPAGESGHISSGVPSDSVIVGSAAGGAALGVAAVVVWYKRCRTCHVPTASHPFFSASSAILAFSSDAGGQTAVPMHPMGSPSSGAGNAVTGPLQSLAAPPPEPSNAFNADDGNVIGVVYSIDALDDYGFAPMVGQALLPPGGQAMEPAAIYHLGISPVPSAP